MKRLILAITICVAFTLTGCQNNNEVVLDDEITDQLNIITTAFPQYDFANNIVEEKADVTLLLSPGIETHSFEPSPKDIIDISNCDVFIYTGGETWVDDLISSIDTSSMTLIRLMDIVDVVEEEIIDGMEHDHDHEHDHDEEHDHDHEHDHDEEHDHDHEHDEEINNEDHTEWDEHVWTSPANAKTITNYIASSLSEIDPANSQYYEDNAKIYNDNLDELDLLFKEVVENSDRKTIVVADRFPFRYLTDEYGLNYYAAFSGCSTQTDASSATIAFLIDKVNDEEIPVVFYTEQSNQKIADVICESTNAKALLLHSCHNLTNSEIESGMDYISLMTQNVENLREALN